ncbi:hypothetical protein [Trueperella pyogenes]|uniref:hypothetical protein n=1 Tax=Trueperella pyogenes TaxID=1661 RepID=UPI00312B8C39
MTEHVWPTAPVIRARWREHGSNTYSHGALYRRAVAGREYINPNVGSWLGPEDGEFTTITEYVEATELEKRLDQIRQLENALRKKNAKLRFQKDVTKNLAYQRKLASDMLSPRALIHHEDKNPDPTPIAHTTIRCIKDNQLLRWMVVVTPPGGPQLPVLFSTYQQAIDWVANELYSQ